MLAWCVVYLGVLRIYLGLVRCLFNKCFLRFIYGWFMVFRGGLGFIWGWFRDYLRLV